mmetsp:Transcript_67171/g.119557  ORF Transcript_67171/g.119557 Transcript_67171/m.119557 type:complete len:259 (+) Transcript_67171:102-878(+)
MSTLEYLRGFCSMAPSLCRRKTTTGMPATAPQWHFELDNNNSSLLDHLRPTVVDIGEIQFPPMVPTRAHSQPRGTSAPHQRGAGNRLQRHQYPHYLGGTATMDFHSEINTTSGLSTGGTSASTSQLYDQRWPRSTNTVPSGGARNRAPSTSRSASEPHLPPAAAVVGRTERTQGEACSAQTAADGARSSRGSQGNGTGSGRSGQWTAPDVVRSPRKTPRDSAFQKVPIAAWLVPDQLDPQCGAVGHTIHSPVDIIHAD